MLLSFTSLVCLAHCVFAKPMSNLVSYPALSCFSGLTCCCPPIIQQWPVTWQSVSGNCVPGSIWVIYYADWFSQVCHFNSTYVCVCVSSCAIISFQGQLLLTKKPNGFKDIGSGQKVSRPDLFVDFGPFRNHEFTYLQKAKGWVVLVLQVDVKKVNKERLFAKKYKAAASQLTSFREAEVPLPYAHVHKFNTQPHVWLYGFACFWNTNK